MQRSFWKNPFTPWILYLGIGFGSIGLGFVVGIITGLIAGTGSAAATASAPFVIIGVLTLALGLVPAIVWSAVLKRSPQEPTPPAPSQQPQAGFALISQSGNYSHKQTAAPPSTPTPAPAPAPADHTTQVSTPEPPFGKPEHGGHPYKPRAAKIRRELPEYPLYLSSRAAGVGRGIEVAGVSHRITALKRAIGTPVSSTDPTLLDTFAQLVPEPTNRYDANAVKVVINKQHIGYLPAETAADYIEPITALVETGYTPTARAEVWALTKNFGRAGDMFAHVRVALAPVHALLPMNNPPAKPYALLPWGGTLQVTGEEKHLDVLSEYVTDDPESLVFFTLHSITKAQKNGVEKQYVEVRLDGERIGQLTPTTSGHFLPTIQHLAAQGQACVVWGQIKGSKIAAQATIHGTKAHELETGWLSKPHTVPALHDYPDLPLLEQDDPDLADDIESIKRDMAREHIQVADDEGFSSDNNEEGA